MTAAKARSLLFGHYDVTNRKVERALMLIGRDADALHKFHIEGDKTNREGEAQAVEKVGLRASDGLKGQLLQQVRRYCPGNACLDPLCGHRPQLPHATWSAK